VTVFRIRRLQHVSFDGQDTQVFTRTFAPTQVEIGGILTWEEQLIFDGDYHGSAYYSSSGHQADFDGDGIVGITDLLALLAAWGPCP
jgi:hypothetical protein